MTTVLVHSLDAHRPAMGSLSASIGGLLALLLESDKTLQVYALNEILLQVDLCWAEVSEGLATIEALYEDPSFPAEGVSTAALIASKVFYHLQEYDTALQYALGAGDKIDLSVRSLYVETLITCCIDKYIAARRMKANSSNKEADDDMDMKDVTDPRLDAIVERMFTQCIESGNDNQTVGIALESHRLDKLEEAIRRSKDVAGVLAYTTHLCVILDVHRDFRLDVLRMVVQVYRDTKTKDFTNLVMCLLLIDDADDVSNILTTLIQSDDSDDHLIAYQLAFDIAAQAPQRFIFTLTRGIPLPSSDADVPSTSSVEVPSTVNKTNVDDDVPMDDATNTATDNASASKLLDARLQRLHGVLSGKTAVKLHLGFLCRNSNTDARLLNAIKSSVEPRNSVLHQGVVFCNAAMHAGTAQDSFLRNNIDWFKRAVNWAKFDAAAALGVIHKGQLENSLTLLQSYLPQDNGSSPYTEGGSLFSLGMIHTGHGDSEIISYLVSSLQSSGGSNTEVLQHGAALGLGCAALASANDDVYTALSSVLYADHAVSGEAAGLAMGLVLCGTASENVQEMLSYSRETQHEKIIRGLSIGMAAVMYGRESEADVLALEQLNDKDALLRYGGCFTLALAYCGTANQDILRKLLHVAVSDVSDDVRRAANMAIGFLLIRVPDKCPKLVELLATSYNPHARYGAAMAVAVACAGTGLSSALDLLEPMMSDTVDYVRQAAYVATAMVLIQRTEVEEPRVATIRAKYLSVIQDKHEETMAKFGALMASGIIDGGGRNCTISLHCPDSGLMKMEAVVGMAVFLQYWYWYPLLDFIAMIFSPTAVIAVNSNMEQPVIKFKSNTRPSLYAYPTPMKAPDTDAKKKVETAILSITTKVQKRDDKKKDTVTDSSPSTVAAMQVDTNDNAKSAESTNDTEKLTSDPAKPVSEPEPEFHLLDNPARVVPDQLKHVSFDISDGDSSRYRPILSASLSLGVAVSGFVVVKDLKPEEEAKLVVTVLPQAGTGESDGDEPPPPEPFQYP